MAKAEVKRSPNGQFIGSGSPSTQFKPGNNANPNGRRSAAKDILNKLLDTPADKNTRRERLMDKLILMAERGNLNAIKEVMDRTEGKPREFVEQKITRDEVVIK
tara:strand:+ start:478 stop:789 length:312 start_codon:yes stop_codon:yes gene_type:complete